MERHIVRATREGDPHAKDLLGAWLDAELLAFFAKDGERTDRVDELIQAASVDILGKLAMAPDDPDLFREFVHSFAGMEVLTSTRNEAREFTRAAALRDKPQTPAKSLSELVLDEQQRQLAIGHAQRLRPVFRDALMHALHGGDYKSLAILQGIEEGTAASRISKAIAKVSQLISDEQRTPPPYRESPNA